MRAQFENTILEWIEMGYNIPEMQLNSLIELSSQLSLSITLSNIFTRFPPHVFMPHLSKIVTESFSPEENVLEAVRCINNYLTLSEKTINQIPNFRKMLAILILRLHHANLFACSAIYPQMLDNIIQLISMTSVYLVSANDLLIGYGECFHLSLAESADTTSVNLVTLLDNITSLLGFGDNENIALILANVNKILTQKFNPSFSLNSVIRSASTLLFKHLSFFQISHSASNLPEVPRRKNLRISNEAPVAIQPYRSPPRISNVIFNLNCPLHCGKNSCLPPHSEIIANATTRHDMPSWLELFSSTTSSGDDIGQCTCNPRRSLTASFLSSALGIELPHSSMPPFIESFAASISRNFEPRFAISDSIDCGGDYDLTFLEYCQEGEDVVPPPFVDHLTVQAVLHQLARPLDSIRDSSHVHTTPLPNFLSVMAILFRYFPIQSLENGIFDIIISITDLIINKIHFCGIINELAFLVDNVISVVASSSPEIQHRVKPQNLNTAIANDLPIKRQVISQSEATNVYVKFRAAIRELCFIETINFDLCAEFGISHETVQITRMCPHYNHSYIRRIDLPPNTMEKLVHTLLCPLLNLLSLNIEMKLRFPLVVVVDKLVFMLSESTLDQLIETLAVDAFSRSFSSCVNDFFILFIEFCGLFNPRNVANINEQYVEFTIYCMAIINNLIRKKPSYFIHMLRFNNGHDTILRLSKFTLTIQNSAILRPSLNIQDKLATKRLYQWLDWYILYDDSLFIWNAYFVVQVSRDYNGLIVVYLSDRTYTIMECGQLVTELTCTSLESFHFMNKLRQVEGSSTKISSGNTIMEGNPLAITGTPILIAISSFQLNLVGIFELNNITCCSLTSDPTKISCNLEEGNIPRIITMRESAFSSIAPLPRFRTVSSIEMMCLCATELSKRIAQDSSTETSQTRELKVIAEMIKVDQPYDRLRLVFGQLGTVLKSDSVVPTALVKCGVFRSLLAVLYEPHAVRAFVNVFIDTHPGFESLRYLIKAVLNAFEVTEDVSNVAYHVSNDIASSQSLYHPKMKLILRPVLNEPGRCFLPDLSSYSITVNGLTSMSSITSFIKTELYHKWYLVRRTCLKFAAIANFARHSPSVECGLFNSIGTNASTRPYIPPCCNGLLRMEHTYCSGCPLVLNTLVNTVPRDGKISIIIDMGAIFSLTRVTFKTGKRNTKTTTGIGKNLQIQVLEGSEWSSLPSECRTELINRQPNFVHTVTSSMQINRYCRLLFTMLDSSNCLFPLVNLEFFGFLWKVYNDEEYANTSFYDLTGTQPVQPQGPSNPQNPSTVGGYRPVIDHSYDLSWHSKYLSFPERTAEFDDTVVGEDMNPPAFHLDFNEPACNEQNNVLWNHIRQEQRPANSSVPENNLKLKFSLGLTSSQNDRFIVVNEAFDAMHSKNLQNYLEAYHSYYRIINNPQNHPVLKYSLDYSESTNGLNSTMPRPDYALDLMWRCASERLYFKHRFYNWQGTSDELAIAYADFIEEVNRDKAVENWSNVIMRRVTLTGKDYVKSKVGSIEAHEALNLLRILYEFVDIHCFGNDVLEYSRLFVSPRISHKVCRSLESYWTVATKSYPFWIIFFSLSYRMLFPYELRFMLLHLCSTGITRAIFNHQTCRGYPSSSLHFPVASRSRISASRIQLKNQVYKVERGERFIDWAFCVLVRAARNEESLNVLFDNENGTGIGPTKEFYHVLSGHLKERSSAMWLTETESGLFPAPLVQDSAIASRTSCLYFLLGLAIGKCVKDSILLDMPLSEPFFRMLCEIKCPSMHVRFERPDNGTLFDFLASIATPGLELSPNEYWFACSIRWKDFLLINPHYAKFLILLRDVIYRKREYMSAFGDFTNLAEYVQIENENGSSTPVEDLGMSFVFSLDEIYQCGPFVELIENGENIDLTLETVELFTWSMIKFMMFEGIRSQMNALLDGLKKVIDITGLCMFTAQELKNTVCGQQTFDWNSEYLSMNLAVAQNTSKTCPCFLNFIEILVDFSHLDKVNFLKFVTGSSSLPFGGLSSLSPPLTVCVSCTGDSSIPYPSANTCCHLIKIPFCESRDQLKDLLLVSIKQQEFFFT